MATKVNGRTVPAESMTPEPGMPRGLKGIENENVNPLGSGSLYTGTPDVGSRTSPAPSTPMSHNLSSDQFAGHGGGGYMPGLRANLQAHGVIHPDLGQAIPRQTPMEHYRTTLRSIALGTAGSANHSLGAALNEDPTMTNAIVNSAGQTAPKGGGGRIKGLLGRLGGLNSGGKGGRGRGRIIRPKPSSYAGMNAKHLANSTGGKG